MTTQDSIICACGFGGYGAWEAKLWICDVEEHGEEAILFDDLRLKAWASGLLASGVYPPVPTSTTSSAW